MKSVIAIAVALSISLAVLASVLGARSACIAAEAGIEAQWRDNQNVFDNVWKDVREEAQVTSEFVSANKALLHEAVAGRAGAAGELVRAIRESNPSIDSAVFTKVMQSIEIAHNKFSAGQTALLDRKRQYGQLYQSPSVLLANRFLSPPFPRADLGKYVIVTSDETQRAFSTGKAGELDVFGK